MRVIHGQTVAVSVLCALLLGALASCSSQESDPVVPDTGAAATLDTQSRADVAVGPEPGAWSLDEGLTVELDFTGRYVASTGEFEFEVEGASAPVSSNGLRTAGQALWCADTLSIVQDGVPGSNPPNTFELVSNSVGTYADCDPATFPDGEPSGLSYANLGQTQGALCAEVAVAAPAC
jgi:hypothetical protein